MDLSQVTLTQMRYAVEIERTGSFRQAADASRVSQSGLSMQVQKLEEMLGAVLFDRSKKPVLVTPAGVTALAQMRAILRETERLGQIVEEGGAPAGRYRLGVIPTLSPTVIPLFLGPFTRAHPRVQLVMGDVGDVIAAAPTQFDAILLDVDNGPDGLVREDNNRLYSKSGLRAAKSALAPGGVLAIWSADKDPTFTNRLRKARFAVDEIGVRARDTGPGTKGKGPMHTIWFATPD